MVVSKISRQESAVTNTVQVVKSTAEYVDCGASSAGAQDKEQMTTDKNEATHPANTCASSVLFGCLALVDYIKASRRLRGGFADLLGLEGNLRGENAVQKELLICALGTAWCN